MLHLISMLQDPFENFTGIKFVFFIILQIEQSYPLFSGGEAPESFFSPTHRGNVWEEE